MTAQCEQRFMLNRVDSERCGKPARWKVTRVEDERISRFECDEHAARTRRKISRVPGLRVEPIS